MLVASEGVAITHALLIERRGSNGVYIPRLRRSGVARENVSTPWCARDPDHFFIPP
jgi:hypothetical protein